MGFVGRLLRMMNSMCSRGIGGLPRRFGLRSSVPRSDDATALALDLLDAAARTEAEDRLDDSKIVDTQQTEEATEDLRQAATSSVGSTGSNQGFSFAFRSSVPLRQ